MIVLTELKVVCFVIAETWAIIRGGSEVLFQIDIKSYLENPWFCSSKKSRKKKSRHYVSRQFKENISLYLLLELFGAYLVSDFYSLLKIFRIMKIFMKS